MGKIVKVSGPLVVATGMEEANRPMLSVWASSALSEKF